MKDQFTRPALSERPSAEQFVFVDELVPGVRWDAKHATWDNFTGGPVDLTRTSTSPSKS